MIMKAVQLLEEIQIYQMEICACRSNMMAGISNMWQRSERPRKS